MEILSDDSGGVGLHMKQTATRCYTLTLEVEDPYYSGKVELRVDSVAEREALYALVRGLKGKVEEL